MKKFLAMSMAVLMSGVAFAANTWPDNQDDKTKKVNKIPPTSANYLEKRLSVPKPTDSKKAGERQVLDETTMLLDQKMNHILNQLKNMTPAQRMAFMAMRSFATVETQHAYYDFHANFQLMDSVRKAYMKISEEERETMTPQLGTLVYMFKDGKKTTLIEYIQMESINLPQKEQETFEAFRVALEKASVQAKNRKSLAALPKAYATALVSFRKTLAATQDVKTVLQAVMAPMDEFYAQLETKPALGPAMAKEFVKPVQTPQGAVKPAEFISAHAIEVLSQPTQDKLFEFVKDLNRLSH